MWCVQSIFFRFTSIHQKIITLIPHHLISKALKFLKIQFYFFKNVSNGVVYMGVANKMLPVYWIEVYSDYLKQSKSLFHVAIKCFKDTFKVLSSYDRLLLL